MPPATSSPVVNSNESPGRKNPISKPDSANTIARIPISPNVEMSHCGSNNDIVGFSQLEVMSGGVTTVGRGIGRDVLWLLPPRLSSNVPTPQRPLGRAIVFAHAP